MSNQEIVVTYLASLGREYIPTNLASYVIGVLQQADIEKRVVSHEWLVERGRHHFGVEPIHQIES